MKQLICPATGVLEVVDGPVPAIGPGELLVRMDACGICGTDLMKVFSPGRAGSMQLGHELVATVVQVGEGVERFAAGQRIAAAHHIPDYSSHFTRRGSESMDALFRRSNIDPGGFAEYVRLPSLHVAYTVLPVPADMPDLRAVFMEPLACCLRALDRVTILEGDSILIVGVGAAGLLFVPVLRDRSTTVLVSDVRPERLELAETWGARLGLLAGRDDIPAACHAATEGRGADLVILTIVTPQTVALALGAVRDGGTILLFGVKPGCVVPVDLWEVWRREVNLISSYSSTPDLLPRSMAILSRPDYSLEGTVSHILPLQDAARGFALAHQGQASKVVITTTTLDNP
jgi:L-iditol 2-dehydrogenase